RRRAAAASSPAAGSVGAAVREAAAGVVTLAAQGLIKRTPAAEYRGRTQQMVAAGVRDDDTLVSVVTCRPGDELLIAHTGGLVIRFSADDVRATGRATLGVAGQQVPAGERCVALSALNPGAPDRQVVTLDRAGAAKRSPIDDYPLQKRGGKGV